MIAAMKKMSKSVNTVGEWIAAIFLDGGALLAIVAVTGWIFSFVYSHFYMIFMLQALIPHISLTGWQQFQVLVYAIMIMTSYYILKGLDQIIRKLNGGE